MLKAGVAQLAELRLKCPAGRHVKLTRRSDTHDVALGMNVDAKTRRIVLRTRLAGANGATPPRTTPGCEGLSDTPERRARHTTYHLLLPSLAVDGCLPIVSLKRRDATRRLRLTAGAPRSDASPPAEHRPVLTLHPTRRSAVKEIKEGFNTSPVPDVSTCDLTRS